MGVPPEWRRDEYDDHDDDSPPAWFPGQHLPADARRMGLTSHVPDGALLDFAGTLDSSKPLHRFTAWVLLVVFGLPVVLAVLWVISALAGG
ncbi:hypothetical protein [Nocardioides sp. LHG3406-4]|uniref:hypothetical protein n=1 Tax=Nocardioides sp. LHG3406-4 TaxID=2804575 RepID=UPI003CF4AD64